MNTSLRLISYKCWTKQNGIHNVAKQQIGNQYWWKVIDRQYVTDQMSCTIYQIMFFLSGATDVLIKNIEEQTIPR